MKPSLTEQVLLKISEENVRPAPRWWFVVRETAMWTAVTFTGVVAAGSIVLAMHRFMAGDVRDMFAAGVPWYQLLMVAGWVGAFVCLFLLVLYEVRCTKRGYRFSLYAISGAGSLVIIGIASVVYTTGMVRTAEIYMAHMMPTYVDTGSARERFWSSPNEGRLLGYVIGKPVIAGDISDAPARQFEAFSKATSSDREIGVEDSTPHMIYIRDRAGHEWAVMIDADISNSLDIVYSTSSRFALFVGERSEEAVFSACGMAIYTHKDERTQMYGQEYISERRLFDGRERLVSAVRTKTCAPSRTDVWRKENRE